MAAPLMYRNPITGEMMVMPSTPMGDQELEARMTGDMLQLVGGGQVDYGLLEPGMQVLMDPTFMKYGFKGGSPDPLKDAQQYMESMGWSPAQYQAATQSQPWDFGADGSATYNPDAAQNALDYVGKTHWQEIVGKTAALAALTAGMTGPWGPLGEFSAFTNPAADQLWNLIDSGAVQGLSNTPEFWNALQAGQMPAELAQAGNYLQYADMPGFTTNLSATIDPALAGDALSAEAGMFPGAEWFNAPEFTTGMVDPFSSEFASLMGGGAAAGGLSNPQWVQELMKATGEAGVDPSLLESGWVPEGSTMFPNGGGGFLETLLKAGPSAAIAKQASDWLGTEVSPQFVSGLGSLLGTGLGGYLGYQSAKDYANAISSSTQPAIDLVKQDMASRLPFQATATNWLMNPQSYLGGDLAKEIGRQTGRAIGGARGENLFDNPTGQSLVMQSLVPSYFNALTQVGNIGWGGNAPLSASTLGNLGITTAQAQGTPNAVLGNVFQGLLGNQAGQTNDYLRQLLLGSQGGYGTTRLG